MYSNYNNIVSHLFLFSIVNSIITELVLNEYSVKQLKLPVVCEKSEISCQMKAEGLSKGVVERAA